MRIMRPLPTRIRGAGMAEHAALFDMMSWMSPAWPIGAFSHSSGLEWAVEAGFVRDRETCRVWIADLLVHGALQGDIVLFVHGWRAARAEDRDAIAAVAELAVAAQTGRERRLESTAQGAAFRRIAAHTAPQGGRLAALLDGVGDADLAYPVAAATLFAVSGVGVEAGLVAFLHGAVSNLVSAAQRLVPLGQTDGQLVLADLRIAILDTAAGAARLPDADPFEHFASAALLAEIGCMHHETQYTRLFRT